MSLRITRGPDAGSATLADPVGRGGSQVPQRRSAGRLRRLLQGARTKPGLRGFSARRRQLEHSHRSRGPEQPPRSAPAGCPLGTVQRSPQQAYPHWCTTMAGAVDVPTFPQFATGDACSRSMDPSLSQDTEGTPLRLSVPSSSEDFNSASGAQDAWWAVNQRSR